MKINKKIKIIFKYLFVTFLINIFLGATFGAFLYFNYDKVSTSKSGVSKKIVNIKNIILEDKNIIVKENATKKTGTIYKGIYGLVKKNTYDTLSSNLYKKGVSYLFLINKENINKQILLKSMVKYDLIDKYIYKKIKEDLSNDKKKKSLEIIKKHLNDVLNLGILIDGKKYNKKTGIETLKDYETQAGIIYKTINKFIKNKSFIELGNYLTLLDKELIVIPKDNLFTGNKLLYDEKFQNVLTKVLKKDYAVEIKQAANIFNIDKKLIYASVAVEQLRYSTTYRAYTKTFLKSTILRNFSKFSYGVGGIKEKTYFRINKNLEGYNKDIYNTYFKKKLTTDSIEIQNILQGNFGFMYIGALIYNIEQKRDKAGYNIDNRPGIITTLYNMGNVKKPRGNPDLGGSFLTINKEYSLYFGELGYIYYMYLNYYVF